MNLPCKLHVKKQKITELHLKKKKLLDFSFYNIVFFP